MENIIFLGEKERKKGKWNRMDSLSGNESNSVTSKGYLGIYLNISKKLKK
jgi:hypothetical protein